MILKLFIMIRSRWIRICTQNLCLNNIFNRTYDFQKNASHGVYQEGFFPCISQTDWSHIWAGFFFLITLHNELLVWAIQTTILKKNVVQENLPHGGATSKLGSQISRPPDKIFGWKVDAPVPFSILYRELNCTSRIQLMKGIRDPRFRSKFSPEILVEDFSTFGSTAESASHPSVLMWAKGMCTAF